MRTAFIVLISLWLVACGDQPAPSENQPVPEPVVEEAAPAVDAAEVAPEPVIEEPKIKVEDVMGLLPTTIRSMLGEPRLIRSEKESRVWLYRHAECVMNFYFYENENGDYALDFIEAFAANLTDEKVSVSKEDCLNNLADLVDANLQ